MQPEEDLLRYLALVLVAAGVPACCRISTPAARGLDFAARLKEHQAGGAAAGAERGGGWSRRQSGVRRRGK